MSVVGFILTALFQKFESCTRLTKKEKNKAKTIALSYIQNWTQKSTVDLIWLHFVHDQAALILAEISPVLGLLEPVTEHKQPWARA